MKVSAVEKKDNKVKFSLEGTTPSFANTVRRLFLSEVPTLAIEEVEFKDNSSILFDETVALRLGLLPLTTDLSTYKLREEVEGGGYGSAEVEVKFSLAAAGPCTVYAEQIKFDDPAVKPVHPKMPIAKLIEGQSLEVHGIAILGKGKEHVKWSPGHIFYTYPESKEATKFDFTVESWGQLPLKDAMEKASEVMDAKLDAFVKALD